MSVVEIPAELANIVRFTDVGIALLPDHDSNDRFFPVSHPQIQTLLGKMLTHIEAMGLPEKAEKANKDLVRQSIYGWFTDVQENSMTSYRGCIGPIVLLRDTNGTERKYVWVQKAGNYAVSVNVDETGNR